jgi:hypothetical protein
MRQLKTEVSNILIFICDSLRFDYLPDEIKSKSIWGRAIAASTFTGSGYPSIVTGKYPAKHRVWTLNETLNQRPQLFQNDFDFGVDATTVWGNASSPQNKPPINMCHQNDNTTISDVESPFVLVVHDTGGHMLYGSNDRNKWNSHESFFNDLRSHPGRIKNLYIEGVRESLDRFHQQCETLRSRGEFEDTLIILTSDHGELLGEYGGLYDHGSPITPELVSVPIAFLGAGLPTDRRLKPLLSTTDVVPTAFAALNEPIPPSVDGSDLWNKERENVRNRTLRSEIWKDPDYPVMGYKSSSAWTTDGGIVCHLSPRISRLAYLLAYEYYYATYANIVRRLSCQTMDHWRVYLKNEVMYGNPTQGMTDRLPREFQTGQRTEDLPDSGPTEEQLRELGYLK